MISGGWEAAWYTSAQRYVIQFSRLHFARNIQPYGHRFGIRPTAVVRDLAWGECVIVARARRAFGNALLGRHSDEALSSI